MPLSPENQAQTALWCYVVLCPTYSELGYLLGGYGCRVK